MNERKLYKRDTKGKLRVWFMEQDGPRHRTYSGIDGGGVTATLWTYCEPTNVGRANERNAEEQAAFEIDAQYKKKLAGEYHESVEATDQGAHFFQPMLAKTYETFIPGFAQPKLDGARCIGQEFGMRSRTGKALPGATHIYEALLPMLINTPGLILDGELYNHELKDDFNTLIGLIKRGSATFEQMAQCRSTVQYHIYDMPSHPGTFSQRFDALNELFDQFLDEDGPIHLVDTIEVRTQEHYDLVHGTCLEAGYEGSMHRLDAAYENKRSSHLRKRKEKQDAEFKLLRLEKGLGNWSNAAKRAVCQLPDGREFGAGIKGSMKRGVELLNEQHDVVTIEFFEYTPDGVPRFPIATKFHGQEKI